MSTDIRTLLDRGAARPATPLDLDAVVQRSRQLGRRRAGATLAVLALVVPAAVLGASLADRDPSPRPLARDPGTATVVAGAGNAVPLPAPGDVVPVVLNDGARVYVVRHDGGDVTVVDGVSTHVPHGVQKQIGWCRTSRGFEDVHHGSRWDDRGRYVFGPATSDLATYAVAVEGERVAIGERRAPRGRSHGTPADGPPCSGVGSIDSAEEQALIANALFADHPTPAAPVVELAEVVAGRRTGVVVVDAVLELAPDGLVICADVSAGTACSGDELNVPLAAGHVGRQPTAVIGEMRLLLNLRDGRVPLTSVDVVRLLPR